MNKSQEKCRRLVKAHVPPGSRVVEFSCGAGKLLSALKADGYLVCGTNFSRHEELPDDLEVHAGVDLRKDAPLADGSADAVILSDVIEHVSDHAALLGEVARILRPDGLSVVLTPNVNRLSSRLQFLFTGFHKIKRAFIGFDVPPDKEFAFHNYPPHLPVFLYQMHSRGMRLVEFTGQGLKVKNLLLWSLFAPAIFLCTWLKTGFGEKNLRRTPESVLLRRTLSSFPALCAESWVAVHRKSTDVPGEARSRLPKWHETEKERPGGRIEFSISPRV